MTSIRELHYLLYDADEIAPTPITSGQTAYRCNSYRATANFRIPAESIATASVNTIREKQLHDTRHESAAFFDIMLRDIRLHRFEALLYDNTRWPRQCRHFLWAEECH